MEKKAAHGLADPQEFSLPSPHALWTKDLYDSFDVEKIPKEKVIINKVIQKHGIILVLVVKYEKPFFNLNY